MARQKQKPRLLSTIMTKLLFTLFFFSLTLEAATLPSKSEMQLMEERLIAKVNAVRTQNGLPSLRTWKNLTKVARIHSENMARKKVPFGHDGFDQRASSLNAQNPLKTLGENVAYSFNVKDHLSTTVTGWMNSPPHRDNILGHYEETGMGIAFASDGSFFVTQLFATRFSSRN